ncbi:hypothetical protein NKH89_10400 [Mesorhizobium sp. M0923]|uniref:hypothetical protein n=1 Tax=Mesorhizobium sp. M0923 TaxID=2957028 RepID=UPI00333BE18A
MSIKARVPKIAKGDEHLATRLGMAVAFQWDSLPPEAQETIIQQATFVEMPPMQVQQKQSLEAFIRQHKVKD